MANKRAISELVTYVLLISLAIAMGGIIYAWMSFYAKSPFPEESCPEVSLIIVNYSCTDNILALNVQNKGRFDVDGYLLKINNGTRDYNIYEMSGANLKTESGKISSGFYNFTAFKSIREIEIEAVRGKDKSGRPILCENSVVRQGISNCP